MYKNQFSLDQIDLVKHFSFNTMEKNSHLSASISKFNYTSNSIRNIVKTKTMLRFKNEKFLDKIKEESTKSKAKKPIQLKPGITNKVGNIIQILELKMQNNNIKKRTLQLDSCLKSKEFSNNTGDNKDLYLNKSKIVSKFSKVRKSSINDSLISAENKMKFNNGSIKNYSQIYSSLNNKNSLALLSNSKKESTNNYNSYLDKPIEPKSKSNMIQDVKNTLGDLKKFRYNSIRKKEIDINLTQNIGNILKKVNKPEFNLDIKSYFKY